MRFKYNSAGRSLTGGCRLVLSVDDIAANVEEIPDLGQGTVVTAQVNLRAVQLGKRRLNFARGVSLGGIGRNSSGSESLDTISVYRHILSLLERRRSYLVCIQALEQIHHLLEEITHFLLRLVIGVAGRLDRVQTGAVLAPFVLPEGLVVPVDVNPVLVHVGEELGAILRLQDLGDIGVGAAGVTVGLVGAVTVVGPGFSVSLGSS